MLAPVLRLIPHRGSSEQLYTVKPLDLSMIRNVSLNIRSGDSGLPTYLTGTPTIVARPQIHVAECRSIR